MARHVGVALRDFLSSFSLVFWMADEPRPLPAGTVLRFEHLDFVATGNGYDMELLPAVANPDVPTPPARRNRRSGQRARQARMERRRAARLSSPTWVEDGMSEPSVAANGVAASSSHFPAPSAPAPPPRTAPEPPREGATAPSPFPFGTHSIDATYASSVSTNMSAYEELPGHHLFAIRNLIVSSPDDSYPETAGSIADDINFFMDNFTTSGVRLLWGP